MGGDYLLTNRTVRRKVFQSTPPHGGRQIIRKRQTIALHRFNPRPHMGGDFQQCCVIARYGVSIHAPTWGATFEPHASGSTPYQFQSTPPHGGRPQPRWPSVHRWSFNPRPHMGGDTLGNNSMTPITLFQSTPPHGGRPTSVLVVAAFKTCFNPRPHMGGDFTFHIFVVPSALFQSTPPHGGRLSLVRPSCLPARFNPRPHMGGDSTRSMIKSSMPCFNPRPHMGGDSSISRLMCMK